MLTNSYSFKCPTVIADRRADIGPEAFNVFVDDWTLGLVSLSELLSLVFRY